ncbi:hypothetical protein ABZP36_033526 [Zizania latifolia]
MAAPLKAFHPSTSCPAAVPQCDFDGGAGDLYEQLISLERALVLLDLQEDDVMIDGDDENCEQLKSLEREFCQLDQQELDVQIQIRKLQRDLSRAEEDLRRVQITPLVVGQLVEIVDEHHAVVTLSDPSQRKRCMDGFDQSTNVRVIMATNRADELDPALLRPGRVDRKIEFTPPKQRDKLLVLQACTAGMSLDDNIDLDALADRHDELNAAEIAAVCREAGMQAVRCGRYTVTREDFHKGYLSVVNNKPSGARQFDFYN